MNTTTKIIIIVVMLAYIVSPIDIAPGPIDDLIVGLIGLASTKRISNEDL